MPVRYRVLHLRNHGAFSLGARASQALRKTNFDDGVAQVATAHFALRPSFCLKKVDSPSIAIEFHQNDAFCGWEPVLTGLDQVLSASPKS
jgi:hypothetical protein